MKNAAPVTIYRLMLSHWHGVNEKTETVTEVYTEEIKNIQNLSNDEFKTNMKAMLQRNKGGKEIRKSKG